MFRRAFACTVLVAASVSATAQQPLTLEDVKDQIVAEFLKNKLPELLSGKSDIFQLKYIEPDTSGGKAGWGIDYKWKASRSSAPSTTPVNGQRFTFGRMSYDLSVDGSYAFNDVTTNQNFSTVKAALTLERGDFGKLNVIDTAISTAFQQCLLAVPAPTTPEEVPDYDRASERCVRAHGIDKMVQAEPGASYYWVDFHGGIEANQDYSDSRTLFGLAGAYAYQPSVARASTNIVDAPFRFMRNAFSGPAGGAYVAPWPSVLLGLERLDAADDDTRTALTTKTTYTRAKAEVAFNTIVANISQHVVRFNVSYRYFHELSAPDAIDAAGLDSFDFVSASLRFPARLLPLFPSDDYELFVSFTSGQLPFNPASDKAIEVGFATNIQALADFLAQ
jgi:hypothetical protein